MINVTSRLVGDGPVPVPSHYYISATRCSPGILNCTEPEIMTAILPHRPYIYNCWVSSFIRSSLLFSDLACSLFDSRSSLTFQNRKIFDYQLENCAHLADLVLMSGLDFLPSLTPDARVRALTFLPEKLWDRLSWLDAFEAGGECPDMTETSCPPG